ncbi:MAG: thioredoxin-like domain-containing protein [Spirosomataceae bacterium]
MKSIQLTIIASILFIGSILPANSQAIRPSQLYRNYIDFLNRSHNLDSVVIYHKMILANPSFAENPLLDILFKNAILEEVLKIRDNDLTAERKIKREFLNSIFLRLEKEQVTESLPLILWVKAANTSSIPTLKSITAKFIELASNQSNYYKNLVGRYGVATYQIIKQEPELTDLAKKLKAVLVDNLKANQIPYEKATSREIEYRRANYRYLYAYMCYDNATSSTDLKEKQYFLKNASDYSPDVTDLDNSIAFMTDMKLLKGKKSFKYDYVDFLTNELPNKTDALNIMVQLAIQFADSKEPLKQFYEKIKTSNKSFEEFWFEEVEKYGRETPEILLETLLNSPKNLKTELDKKWVMIDFWGTWCGPCISEHPELQKFYDSVANSGEISLITVACKDTEDKVLKYLQENRYTFPVVMADEKIEDDFQITSFPSKILITPNRKFILIPHYMKLQEGLKHYSNL